MELPRVRFLDVRPYHDRFILTDPYRLSEPAVVTREVLLILSLMDGTRDELEIRTEFLKRTGNILTSEDYRRIVSFLDENYLLLNERFFKRLEEEREKLLHSGVLRPFHAGEAYPSDPRELKRFLDSSLTEERKESPAGILVPHMDMRVAIETYGKVYSKVDRKPDTVLILGVSHYAHNTPFSVCPLRIETPLGEIEPDKEVIKRLRSSFEHDIFEDILSYRMEHSIEFQAVFVKHLFPQARVVPAIVSYGSAEELEGVAERLARAVEDRDVLVISSVDMSHVGRKFGDPFSYDPSPRDKEYIGLLSKLDNRSAFKLLEKDNNRTRIDGQFTNHVFVELVKKLGAQKGKEIDYRVYNEKETDSKVSYAGMLFS